MSAVARPEPVVSSVQVWREAADAPSAVIVVLLGRHRCGLPVEVVVELHRMVATVPLPDAPDVIDGVIDMRGAVIAVLDLRSRFGLVRRPANPTDHLVVVNAKGRTVALRVDRVLDLVTVPDRSVVAAVGLPRLRGVARLDDGLLLIHDVGAFLSDDEAAALDDALAALGAMTGDEA